MYRNEWAKRLDSEMGLIAENEYSKEKKVMGHQYKLLENVLLIS